MINKQKAGRKTSTSFCADGETRTHTGQRPLPPQSSVSTISPHPHLLWDCKCTNFFVNRKFIFNKNNTSLNYILLSYTFRSHPYQNAVECGCCSKVFFGLRATRSARRKTKKTAFMPSWGAMWGSNPRHLEPQSSALPTELIAPFNSQPLGRKDCKYKNLF